MKVFVEFVGSVFFVDLKLSQNPFMPTTLMPVETPSRPWEKLGVDLFSFDNKDFLIKVDYLSNYWEIDKLNNTLVSTVVLKLESHFARNGYPPVKTDPSLHPTRSRNLPARGNLRS